MKKFKEQMKLHDEGKCSCHKKEGEV